MKIVVDIFEKMENFKFFSYVWVGRKRKKQAGDICKGILDIEFERDWSVGLGATLSDATD